jgi:hypothetical protein
VRAVICAICGDEISAVPSRPCIAGSMAHRLSIIQRWIFVGIALAVASASSHNLRTRPDRICSANRCPAC